MMCSNIAGNKQYLNVMIKQGERNINEFLVRIKIIFIAKKERNPSGISRKKKEEKMVTRSSLNFKLQHQKIKEKKRKRKKKKEKKMRRSSAKCSYAYNSNRLVSATTYR